MPRIVRFHQTGGPEVLQIAEEPLVEPKQGEVRLRVQALGLNRAESMFRSGAYLEAPQLPSRLGYEAAGIVDAVGPNVSNVKVGDRVSTIPSFGLSAYGVYGESAVVPASAVAAYPSNMSPEQGAAIWMQYMTAWIGLIERAQLQKGQVALITAASSSVGLAAIQIAKATGARAIAVTRKSDKKARLLEAGADHVIASTEEDLPERVAALTDGKGANLIFDPVSGPYVETLAQAAAKSGKIIIYGLLDMRPTPFPLFPAFQKGLWMHAYALFECTTDPVAVERGKRYIYDGLQSGKLKPILDPNVFTLDQIVEAHRYLESNQQFGKIVVRV
ncbi:MAG TPA: zinc-dependent alcohol dehydrogenase family protein [Burkholderiales bacterium]|nr:zinc-dependent alcohol dehydrogenase family protein [Burkholderiales bacterium]